MGNTQHTPGFRHAFLTFFSILLVISLGIFYLKTSLHSLLLIALIIASVSALPLAHYRFAAIRKAMNSGISNAFSAIYIFILIGVLIAAFIQSGTIATLIYYGTEMISPVYFLPAGLLLCSIMAVATGTSWGTVATAGVVLMGIGSAMGIPLPLVAGMVISGASFGDKMSPVSDTTNLAAMSAKVKLNEHIKSMSYTTAPTYLLVLLLFTYLGLQYSDTALPVDRLTELQDAITSVYNINLLTLLPLLIMLILSTLRFSAEPVMMLSVIAAVILALILQDKELSTVLTSLYSGEVHHSGLKSLDDLLSRGGIGSMMWTLSLALIALALGGVLSHFGFLRVLVLGFIKKISKPATLISVTIFSCFFGNITMAEAYLSIILGGHLFGHAYDKLKTSRLTLSRSLEDGATLTAGLIPWTTGGAFFASALGVPVLDYAPYALLNWMNPLISILLSYMGLALFREKVKD